MHVSCGRAFFSDDGAGAAAENWTHATTRNCASMAVDAGGASGVTLPSALGTWTGPIAGFVATYSGEMPWVLHGRL